MVLWAMPVPVTALFCGARFSVLQKRMCSLTFNFEGDDCEPQEITLVFDGIEVFKCTFMTSCTAEMFDLAYGKVVDLGRSDLKHLMITLDDGPCYEFICQKFRV